MAKGIDQKFVHYGIQRESLSMIEAICDTESMNFDWLSEKILKAYHAKKVDVIGYTPQLPLPCNRAVPGSQDLRPRCLLVR